jgi:hypothetical protein
LEDRGNTPGRDGSQIFSVGEFGIGDGIFSETLTVDEEDDVLRIRVGRQDSRIVVVFRIISIAGSLLLVIVVVVVFGPSGIKLDGKKMKQRFQLSFLFLRSIKGSFSFSPSLPPLHRFPLLTFASSLYQSFSSSSSSSSMMIMMMMNIARDPQQATIIKIKATPDVLFESCNQTCARGVISHE